jgi:hypothetical protein
MRHEVTDPMPLIRSISGRFLRELFGAVVSREVRIHRLTHRETFANRNNERMECTR